MFRIMFTLEGPGISYGYLDSVHAAIVAGLKAAGLAGETIVGLSAHPWTFAAKGFARPGGRMVLKGLTISSPNPAMGEALMRLRPVDVRSRSANGDEIDLRTARKTVVGNPLPPGQTELAICFASPFLLTQPRRGPTARKIYLDSLHGQDLSVAFSKGLSRRLGRAAYLDVRVDPLSLATDGARPRIVSLRKTPNRKVSVPAFSVHMTLRGAPEDLRAAYFAGLGEKTRYGFGCPAVLA